MSEINKEIILAAIEKANVTLQPTHQKLCLPIINRIYKKMSHGIKFEEIKVCNTLIIDGHHRYISSLLAKVALDEIKWLKTSTTNEYQ